MNTYLGHPLRLGPILLLVTLVSLATACGSGDDGGDTSDTVDTGDRTEATEDPSTTDPTTSSTNSSTDDGQRATSPPPSSSPSTTGSSTTGSPTTGSSADTTRTTLPPSTGPATSTGSGRLVDIRPVPIQSVSEAVPATLEVVVEGGVSPCFIVDRVEKVETADQVELTVMAGSEPGAVCIQIVELHEVTVELTAPLGDRTVIDGTTGRPV